MAKRKRKPVPVVEAKCDLCEHFYHSNITKGGQVHNTRWCRQECREIHSTDVACESFLLAPYFSCDNTNHRITVAMCHHRAGNKWSECRKCRQRPEVLVAEALSGAIIPQTTGLKRRAGATGHASKVREPNPTPIILKRRVALEEGRRVLKVRVNITK